MAAVSPSPFTLKKETFFKSSPLPLSRSITVKDFLIPLLAVQIFFPDDTWAMHIMEGFLPANWALFWTLIAFPFIIYGWYSVKKITDETPKLKLLLALAGAFVFALSAMKLPSVAGSSSHPTGVALGAILFGVGPMGILGTITLLFQALLLAHGGITTLGANVFSMAIVGPMVAIMIYTLGRKAGLTTFVAVFLAGALGDFSTYVVTAFQLALAFPAAEGGTLFSFEKFLSVFAITQIPLAILDGIVTAMAFSFLKNYRSEDLTSLNLPSKGI